MASNHISRVTAGGLTNATLAPSIYGYCTTAAATAAKVVTMYSTGTTAGADWATADLFHGLTIFVRFQYANGVANPTLNVNNTGAKPIYRYGTTAPSTSAASSWNAQSIVSFTYDTLLKTDGCWVMHDWLNNNDNTYPSVYIATGASTAAKAGTLSNASWSGLTGNRYIIATVYYDNTSATALTLNVNSQGAKPIYINGSASSTSNYTLPRGMYIVYYDGTNFYFRTDGKIPKLKTSGSIGVSTTSVGSASAGTAIAADDITAWSAGSAPTLGTAIAADDITDWSAGTLPTLGTAIPADDITAWTTNTPTQVTKKTVVTDATFNTVVTSVTKKTVVTGTSVSNEVLSFTTGDSVTVGTGVSGSKTTGDSVTVTAGTAASLSYTAKSIPNVTGVGTLPSLSYTARSIPNVTSVGSAPSLSYTARSIPNISVSSVSVVNGLTEA